MSVICPPDDREDEENPNDVIDRIVDEIIGDGLTQDYSPHRDSCRPLSDFDVEPWRYQCPDGECRSHQVIVRKKAGHSKTHREARVTMAEQDSLYIHRFRCDACSNVFDKPHDKKHGEQRTPEIDFP